jgi:hypothetical protein
MGIFSSFCHCGEELNWFLKPPENYICKKCHHHFTAKDIELSHNSYYRGWIAGINQTEHNLEARRLDLERDESKRLDGENPRVAELEMFEAHWHRRAIHFMKENTELRNKISELQKKLKS